MSRCRSSQGCSTSPYCSSSDPLDFSQPRLGIWLVSERQGFRTRQTRHGPLKEHYLARRQSCLVTTTATRLGSTDGDAENVVKSSKAAPAVRAALEGDRAVAKTQFIAETLLPTSSGKFRLRGYRHTIQLVRLALVWAATCWLDDLCKGLASCRERPHLLAPTSSSREEPRLQTSFLCNCCAE